MEDVAGLDGGGLDGGRRRSERLKNGRVVGMKKLGEVVRTGLAPEVELD